MQTIIDTDRDEVEEIPICEQCGLWVTIIPNELYALTEEEMEIEMMFGSLDDDFDYEDFEDY